MLLETINFSPYTTKQEVLKIVEEEVEKHMKGTGQIMIIWERTS